MLSGRLNLRVTNTELEFVRDQAEKAGLSVSEYARRCVLGRKVESKIEIKMLAELRRLMGLLKHVYVESGGVYSIQIAEVLDDISLYISKLSKL